MIGPPAGVNATLRATALGAIARELGITVPETPGGVWGVIADLGLPNGCATLVALADGTASIYWGESGGVIGGQSHESVRDAVTAAVNAMGTCSAQLAATGVQPLPAAGHVRLYAHGRAGLISSEELPLSAVAGGGHPLSGCFSAINDVITQLRLVSSAGG